MTHFEAYLSCIPWQQRTYYINARYDCLRAAKQLILLSCLRQVESVFFQDSRYLRCGPPHFAVQRQEANGWTLQVASYQRLNQLVMRWSFIPHSYYFQAILCRCSPVIWDLHMVRLKFQIETCLNHTSDYCWKDFVNYLAPLNHKCIILERVVDCSIYSQFDPVAVVQVSGTVISRHIESS